MTQAPPKIIVVEDDLVVQLVITEALTEELDVDVVVFETADEALEYVTQPETVCNLLVADHGVKGELNGSKLATVFKSRWPDCPVIVTSGYELDSATLPDGVVLVPKPWSIEQITQTVARLL